MDKLLLDLVKLRSFKCRVKFFLATSVNKFSEAEIKFVAKGVSLILRLLRLMLPFTASMTYIIYKPNIIADLKFE